MVIVLSGPGGAGKGTVVSRVLALEPDIVLSRSWTTRSRREGEDEDAYEFVERDRFEAHRAAGNFLETNELGDWLYGTPVPRQRPHDRGDLLLEIEVNGGRQVLDVIPDALMIFLDAPSKEEQRARLLHRGDDPAHVELRMTVGEQERREAERLGYITVINDDLDRCVDEIRLLIARHRPQER